MSKRYSKYKDQGALHWEWYEENKHGYKDLVNCAVNQFEGKSGTVLDIGSGDGLPASLLIAKGLKVIGIEPEPEGNAIASVKVPLMETFQETIEEYLEDAPGFHDFMLSINTIEHVEDPNVFVKAMDMVNCFAVIITDNAENRKEVNQFHVREFKYSDLESLFKDFKTEKVETGNPEFIGIKVYTHEKN